MAVTLHHIQSGYALNRQMEADDGDDSKGAAMTHHGTFALVALLVATFGSQVQAGMSGTSREGVSQAHASVPASAPARARPAQVRREPAPPLEGDFDGVWTVVSSPGCGLVARSAVQVVHGRIIGERVTGSVDAAGNVHTVARGGGVSVISKGRTSPTSGSGTYKVSNGCTGTWVSRKV
jgi:hypothetical protein